MTPRQPLRASLALLAALLAAGVHAQTPAAQARDEAAEAARRPVALVADRVTYDETTGELVAEGAVEVYSGPRTLTAARIFYDSRSGRIRAEGPMTLRDPSGAVALADAAEIDDDLRAGVIEGARALIGDGSGAIAAVEARRIDGRYTALGKAVFSPCKVCAASPTPLWAIRAERVVHDEVARDVHYENPVFEVAGVPVMWLPWFSHPDPGVKRRTGFLAPDFIRSSTYGYAVKAPYFIEIDPTRDATLTPFLTTDDGPILEAQYRQRLDWGRIDLEGSVGRTDFDDGDGAEGRGHIFGFGRFDLERFGLPEGVRAGFDLALTSDDGFLERYDFSDEDRLTSEAFVERYGRRDFFRVAGVYFQSLRANEPAGEIPFALPEFSLRRVFDMPALGGEAGLGADGVWLTRTDGRDAGRLTLNADWSRETVLNAGLVMRGFATARADMHWIGDDPALDDDFVLRLAPNVGVEARFPLIRDDGGVAHVLEPIAQLVVAPTDVDNGDVPNEDSLAVEFDETNLFDVDRFPGLDRIETGTRLNYGLRYTRASDGPISFDASVGQVLRLSEVSAFSPGSGLADEASDVVGAWRLGWAPYATVANRFRLNDDLDVARFEFGAAAKVGAANARADYVFLSEDATAGAIDDREEVTLGLGYAIDRNWRVDGFMRRDLQNDEFVETTASIGFRNECAAVELRVSRDFTDSADDPASTSFGVRVRLFGGADGASAQSGVCDGLVVR